MAIHRISNYWSKDSFLGVRPIQEAMSLNRFWAIWSNLHLVDNEELEGSGGGGPYRKVKPLLLSVLKARVLPKNIFCKYLHDTST